MSCQHKWSKVFGFIAYSYKMQGLLIGMQTIIDTTYAYGNAYDIIINLTKSQ